LREVTVLAPIFRARRLMLVVVIFLRLAKTNRRQARRDARHVISAAPQAIEAENQANVVAPVDFLDGARQFARRRIDSVGPAAGKNAHAMRPAGSRIRTNNVVIQIATDGVAIRLQVFQQLLRAQKTLLLAGERREE